MANWLDIAFFSVDRQFFIFMNGLERVAGDFLTPFFKFVSFFGEGGIFLLILSVFLMFFAKTRKIGMAMLLAIGVGALFTNVIIKNAVQRIRPFYKNELYFSFWQSAGKTAVTEYSFPSGHTTVTMTSMTALFLSSKNKKISWLVYTFVFLTALSRTYLIVHYLTDIIGGLIVGFIGGIAGYYLSKYFYSLFNRYSHKKFCAFMLNADIKNLFNKEKKD